MEDLPKHINAETRKLTIVVSRESDHFRMVVRPRWYTDGNAAKTIGGEILISQWMLVVLSSDESCCLMMLIVIEYLFKSKAIAPLFWKHFQG